MAAALEETRASPAPEPPAAHETETSRGGESAAAVAAPEPVSAAHVSTVTQSGLADASAHEARADDAATRPESKREREPDAASDEGGDRKRRKDVAEPGNARETSREPAERAGPGAPQHSETTAVRPANDEPGQAVQRTHTQASETAPAGPTNAAAQTLVDTRADRPGQPSEALAAAGSEEPSQQSAGSAEAAPQAEAEAEAAGAALSRDASAAPSASTGRAPSREPSEAAAKLEDTRTTDGAAEAVAATSAVSSLRIDSSGVLASVASLSRRPLGSVIYEPGKILARGHELDLNCVLQVRVGHEYLTRDGAAVKRRMLWGTQVYTDDSDLVAVLAHEGLLPESAPGDLNVEILLLPVLEKYVGSYRHGVNSREWRTRHDGISYMVLGQPRVMPAGWSFSGVEQQAERIRLLAEARQWTPVELAYADSA